MLVSLTDGACRTCGGQLEITDFDDATMTVLCTSPGCGDSYDVETNAFGDGCITYYFALLSGRANTTEEA
jgi:hypothetical protein